MNATATQDFLSFDVATETQKAVGLHVIADWLHLSTDRVLVPELGFVVKAL